MKITEKLAKKAKNNWDYEGVTIAFLGDSVTQGCFEIYRESEDSINTIFDKNYAYHSYFARIMAMLYPSVPVNIINAGISGGSAPHALERLDRDVLKHAPDLTVVCFGLNDCGNGSEGLDNYVNALDQIFTKLQEAESEIIFMTPNMMATHVSCHITDSIGLEIAKNISRSQNEGILEMYLNAAKELCQNRGITICDCYEKWKKLYAHGVNVTELLSNKLNHPTREMNWLFAISLTETIMTEL